MTVLVVAVLAVVCVVVAPHLTELVRPEYERAGAVLVCLLLAAVPRTIMIMQISTLRAQRRGGSILTVHVVTVAATAAALVMLVPSRGLDGVGIGWLLGSLVGFLAAMATRWGERLAFVTSAGGAR
jgi:O-antigen/teichoic acid export membrane protein